MFGCHYASKVRFYSHNYCLPLRTWLFFVVFSTFHIKVQLFCFLLKQFFEIVKKKSLRSGGLERVGRVTVNTTFFFRVTVNTTFFFFFTL